MPPDQQCGEQQRKHTDPEVRPKTALPGGGMFHGEDGCPIEHRDVHKEERDSVVGQRPTCSQGNALVTQHESGEIRLALPAEEEPQEQHFEQQPGADRQQGAVIVYPRGVDAAYLQGVIQRIGLASECEIFGPEHIFAAPFGIGEERERVLRLAVSDLRTAADRAASEPGGRDGGLLAVGAGRAGQRDEEIFLRTGFSGRSSIRQTTSCGSPIAGRTRTTAVGATYSRPPFLMPAAGSSTAPSPAKRIR